jgi:hypothetical protein
MELEIPKKLEMKSLLPAPRSRTSFSHSGGFIFNPTIRRSIGRQPTVERELQVRAIGWKLLYPMLGNYRIACRRLYRPVVDTFSGGTGLRRD